MSSLSSEAAFQQVRSLLGSDRVREPDDRETQAAFAIAEPRNDDEIAALVQKCESDRVGLVPIGFARTASQIRRQPVAFGVSLAHTKRIVAYEPGDMTVIAEAGLTVGELNDTTAKSGQRLPVDPQMPSSTTVGSLIAAAHAGPLRLSEGTVRDLVIGIRFVGQGGRVVHGGGRVVKNVAGYDLMKVLCGSFGTLGIITEATFKVRPIPEGYRVAVAPHERAESAFAHARALHDSLSLAHLEVLSPGVALACGRPGKFVLIAGITGSHSEVRYQADTIKGITDNVVEFLEPEEGNRTYEWIRDFDPGAHSLAARVALPPAQLQSFLTVCDAEFIAHAGSGVAEIFATVTSPSTTDLLAKWRTEARRAGGHIRVLHCDPSERSSIEYFDAPNATALNLMRRLKSAFDPSGVFNPRAFVGGI